MSDEKPTSPQGSEQPITTAGVVATLKNLGIPLRPEQEQALLNEGHRSMKGLRADVREAVKRHFTVTPETVKRAVEEIVTREMAQYFDGDRIKLLVNERVSEVINKQFGGTANIKDLIAHAARAAMNEYVNKNLKVDITLNEAGHYQNGGSF